MMMIPRMKRQLPTKQRGTKSAISSPIMLYLLITIAYLALRLKFIL
jgi:hypothetical protein